MNGYCGTDFCVLTTKYNCFVATFLKEKANIRSAQALTSPRLEQILEVPEEEIDSEVGRVNEGVAALKERQEAAIQLAPEEQAASETKIPSVIHPHPVQAATQEEVQRDVREAEAEVRQVEGQKQAETEIEIDEEMQQLLEEHQHVRAAAAAASAAQEVAAEEAASASEAEQEVWETTSATAPHLSLPGEGHGAPVAAETAPAPARAPEHGSSTMPAAEAASGAEAATTQTEGEDGEEEEYGSDTTTEDGGVHEICERPSLSLLKQILCVFVPLEMLRDLSHCLVCTTLRSTND
ncbi:hypothetical protein, conserved [Eimeria acervulina]|uniref:Uncharacterized protein n=1 Tax=Eimeria acervulina TaxID=5801 RepID=U6GAL0_EIMAC|nr:hypothetical protein, conserved [Eimeria acervulina]CDI76383.1 hypothetical protein, conserved [Eimeria acervulina]